MDIQISKSCENEGIYNLSVVLDFIEYHCSVEASKFVSTILEIDCIPDAIREGFSNIQAVKKLDENLNIETVFIFSEDKSTLLVNLELCYSKGSRLKSTKEHHDFELHRKSQDIGLKLEKMHREFEKSLNMCVVREQSSNCYISIFTEKRICYIMNESEQSETAAAPEREKCRQYLIGPAYNIAQGLLNFMLQTDEKVKRFFENRINSQENINMFLHTTIDQYFETTKIHELLLNFISHMHCINFFKVLNKGRKIFVNYNTSKHPVPRTFIVTENVYKYKFSKSEKYAIIQDFCAEKKQANYCSRVEIILSGDNYLILENGYVAKNKCIALKNNLVIETTETGHLYKIYFKKTSPPLSGEKCSSNTNESMSCVCPTKFSGEIESPSMFLKMTFFEGNLILMSLNTRDSMPMQPYVPYLVQIKQGAIEECFYSVVEKISGCQYGRTSAHSMSPSQL
jgi:hypothetical protein